MSDDTETFETESLDSRNNVEAPAYYDSYFFKRTPHGKFMSDVKSRWNIQLEPQDVPTNFYTIGSNGDLWTISHGKKNMHGHKRRFDAYLRLSDLIVKMQIQNKNQKFMIP